MALLRSIEELARIPSPIVLAAGVFDGMHLGHRAVLEAACESAKRIEATPVVLTFDPHPASVLRPNAPVRLLTPQDLKLQLISQSGIPHTLVVPFYEIFAQIEPEDFIELLLKGSMHLSGICIGEGWRFGRNRKGNPDLLRSIGMRSGFFTSEVPSVCVNGHTVSSTFIRQALTIGDIEKANRCLGRPFSVSGVVVEGDRLGARIGFPTANIATDGRQYPADGVYVIEVSTGGNQYQGVANLGIRPTVTSSKPRVLEAHIFQFNGNLYGVDLEVSFLHRLRPEQRFNGIEALKERIALDCAKAIDWLQQNHLPR